MRLLCRLRCSCAALVAACSLLIAARNAAASIQFQFVDHPAYQTGYTLAGTITTDGTLGAITSSDILNWSFTISQGTSQVFSLSSNGGSTLITPNYVYEDASHIYVSPTSSDGSDFLFLKNGASGSAPLAYMHQNTDLVYQGAAPPSLPFWSSAISFTDPLTIAQVDTPVSTVPEPTSAICFVGVIALGGVFLRRHFGF